MATSSALLQKYKEALALEKQSCSLLSSVLEETDTQIEDSKQLMKHYTELAVKKYSDPHHKHK